jgi:hypothetical protein
MIRELEMVALVEDVPEHGLRAGDVGTVVHIYPSGESCEIELFAIDGKTLDVVNLALRQLRPVESTEIMQARPANAV